MAASSTAAVPLLGSLGNTIETSLRNLALPIDVESDEALEVRSRRPWSSSARKEERLPLLKVRRRRLTPPTPRTPPD